ncbi:MAG: cyclase family protein, partial [Methanothrix sp.]|nr:cyclase family protein [Methanothrix sp.]
MLPISSGLNASSDLGTSTKADNSKDNSSFENSSLWQVFDILESKGYVDLTHSFRPGIPHWQGFPNETVDAIFNFSTSGFLAQKFCLVGQWGTHVDAPAHFHQGKRTVDQIDVKEMLLPLVVLDIHENASANPDYTISMDDVSAWESRYGKIPEGCFVALRTDW